MAGTTKGRKPTKRAPAPVKDVEELTPEELAALQAEAEAALDEIVPVDEDGKIRPVEIGKRGRTPNPLVHIFTLDGERFFVPERPSPMMTMRFLRTMRRKGQARAVEELLTDYLGDAAVDALAKSPEVEDADVAAIFGIITKIVFGSAKAQQEATQGN